MPWYFNSIEGNTADFLLEASETCSWSAVGCQSLPGGQLAGDMEGFILPLRVVSEIPSAIPLSDIIFPALITGAVSKFCESLAR